MERTIETRYTYAHPPHRVWRMLTDPEALSVWLAESDFLPRVGHPFKLEVDARLFGAR